MAWIVVTPSDPRAGLDLAEVKDWLKISDNRDDALLKRLIGTAVLMIERFTNQVFLTATWDMWMDRTTRNVTDGRGPWWAGERTGHQASIIPGTNLYIKLTKNPVQSIVSINTYDLLNVATLFPAANFFLDDVSTPARIALNSGFEWPFTDLREINAFQVTAKLGYGDALTDQEDDIQTALQMQLFDMYENRGIGEQKLTDAVKEILEPFVLWDLE